MHVRAPDAYKICIRAPDTQNYVKLKYAYMQAAGIFVAFMYL